MFCELSICTLGIPDAAPHCVKFVVATGSKLFPGLASTTIRNVPALLEKICGVGPGTYGVGVGPPEQSHKGVVQYAQPSLVARPK